jgi:hypothetical protein
VLPHTAQAKAETLDGLDSNNKGFLSPSLIHAARRRPTRSATLRALCNYGKSVFVGALRNEPYSRRSYKLVRRFRKLLLALGYSRAEALETATAAWQGAQLAFICRELRLKRTRAHGRRP